MSSSYVVSCYLFYIDEGAGEFSPRLRVWHQRAFDDLNSANVYADFQRRCGGYDKVDITPVE